MGAKVRLAAVGVMLLLGVPAALAVAAWGAVPITVKPKTGAAHTKFVVSFRAPAATDGTSATHRYSVSAAKSTTTSTGATGPTGPTGETGVTGSSAPSGCVSTTSRQITAATQGQRLNVALKPGASKAWCAGLFKGVIKETTTPKCSAGQACPDYIAISTVGTFRFRAK
ncbi:MAG TPA: hypothetical protein VMD09_10050 [Solirubrobacteraceae bacterium]|nr:hypothetical protein [Solirubrobacteraceae bacterium]